MRNPLRVSHRWGEAVLLWPTGDDQLPTLLVDAEKEVETLRARPRIVLRPRPIRVVVVRLRLIVVVRLRFIVVIRRIIDVVSAISAIATIIAMPSIIAITMIFGARRPDCNTANYQ